MDVIFTLICVSLLSESFYFARHGGKPLPFSSPTKVIIGLVGLAAVAAMLLMLRAPLVASRGGRVLLPTFGWALRDWAVVLIMLVGFGQNGVLLCKGIVGQSRMIAGRLKTAIEYSPLLVIALGGAYVLHAKSARRHAAVQAAVAWEMERTQHKGVASAAGSAEVRGETVLLKDGFDSGQLALTFTAKEEGAKLELKVKNQTSAALIVTIESGTTTFHLGQQTIVISTSTPKMLNVGASAEVTVLLDQGGGARMTKGSMTVSKKPPKK